MKKSFIKNLATCFGLGDMPKAPGTFGTLGGIPIYIGMLFLRKVFPNHMLYNSFYFMFLMTFFVVAVYVSDIAEKEIYHKKDPQNAKCVFLKTRMAKLICLWQMSVASCLL